MQTALSVRHNIEVAHRIHDIPGKCQNLHGHSMWVTLVIQGDVHNGIVVDAAGKNMMFGDIKKYFREYLDTYMDHGTVLCVADPIYELFRSQFPSMKVFGLEGRASVENIAEEIYTMMRMAFHGTKIVTVDETHANGVACGDL